MDFLYPENQRQTHAIGSAEWACWEKEDFWVFSAGFIYYNVKYLDFIEEGNDFLVISFPMFSLIILIAGEKVVNR